MSFTCLLPEKMPTLVGNLEGAETEKHQNGAKHVAARHNPLGLTRGRATFDVPIGSWL